MPSDGSTRHSLSPAANGIGELFRSHGEDYIRVYKPSHRHIKLIRSIRICRTAALGGSVIICNTCGERHYIYHSCGNSLCPICQSIKREQWVDKLSNALFKVPYVHVTFTLPHELNGLARRYPWEIYSLLMRSSWATIKELSSAEDNVGGLPGMISVLHTFGSDMKYHVHVHSLVSFGGIDRSGKWRFPKRRNKLAPYRQVCRRYKEIFLSGLEELFKKKKISYHTSYDALVATTSKLRWVVHHTRPSMDTKVVEQYLSRYISRTAISNSRLKYLKETQEVKIIFNDYKHQKGGEAAPKKERVLDPLNAMHQFLQHVLPPYFQKSRRYGLHASMISKKYKQYINSKLKRDHQAIRTVFQILKDLIKEEPFQCTACKSMEYTIEVVKPEVTFIYKFINKKNFTRAPPKEIQIC